MPRPSFYYRDLYHRADKTLDFDAAKNVVTDLVHSASAADLAHAIGELQMDLPEFPDPDRARADVERDLHQRLDTIAETLTTYEVLTLRFVRGDEPGIQAYITGGVSIGDDDAPTDAYDAWEILMLPNDVLPKEWGARIAIALGLIDPHGTGPIAATVSFRSW